MKRAWSRGVTKPGKAKQSKAARDSEVMKAASSGSLSKLQAMVWEGNINEPSPPLANALLNGRTLLHCAVLATANDAACVAWLLAGGANVDARTEHGESALHLAALGRRAYVVALLVDAGADASAVNGEGDTALHMCIEGRDPKVVKGVLVAQRGDGGDAEAAQCAQMLLDGGAPVDAVDMAGYTPLLRAAFRDNADMVRLLLEYGADAMATDPHGCTALHWAAINRRDETAMLRYIVSRDDLVTPLDVDARDAEDNTALHLAALHNCAECARMLLACGARRDVRNRLGETPLETARRGAGDACVRLLAERVESDTMK